MDHRVPDKEDKLRVSLNDSYGRNRCQRNRCRSTRPISPTPYEVYCSSRRKSPTTSLPIKSSTSSTRRTFLSQRSQLARRKFSTKVRVSIRDSTEGRVSTKTKINIRAKFNQSTSTKVNRADTARRTRLSHSTCSIPSIRLNMGRSRSSKGFVQSPKINIEEYRVIVIRSNSSYLFILFYSFVFGPCLGFPRFRLVGSITTFSHVSHFGEILDFCCSCCKD